MTKIASSEEIKFYTTGFAGRDINELKPMLDRAGAILVDVRFSLNDGEQMLRWRQIYLKALLREKYRHISHLGTRTNCAGLNDIHHLDLGLKILLSFGTNVVLMCECANERDCHRHVITKELRRRGFEVNELTDWKTGAS